MIEKFSEFLIASGLFVVVLATILKELKFFQKFWTRFPFISHFVPSWSFFAPDPYQVDYFILCRFICENKHVEQWKQIYDLKKMRSSYSFFWNPRKWFLKAVVDVVTDLLRVISEANNKNTIYLSLPYLNLLNFVYSMERPPQAEKIQFVIMSKSEETEPEIIFLSEIHPLK